MPQPQLQSRGNWRARLLSLALGSASILLAVIACNLTSQQEPLPTEPPTPTQVVGGPTFAPVVTITPRTSPTVIASGCTANANALGTRYDIDATINIETHIAKTTMQATYRNDTGRALDQIVFNVEPNRKPGVFTLVDVTADTPTVIQQYNLTGPRLEINLRNPVPPKCEATFMLSFSVQPGPIAQSYIDNIGYFGFSDRQLNLAGWLPQFAPYRGGEFYTPKGWPLGEYVVTDWSDFTAAVKLMGKDADKWQVVGPGATEQDGGVVRFRLAGGRSFVISVNAAQAKISAQTDDGADIDLYYFLPDQPAKDPSKTAEPHEANAPNAAIYALETARNALNRYTKLYGPIPYRRMVVVEGDFPDGMEFSGLVFVSLHWFATYSGAPDSWLTLILTHELAHQWWYSLIGDDQGNAPFLDESLAVYSESLYFEDKYPALLGWWWAFRVTNYGPQGYVDSKVYDYQNLRMYLNAVYLRGAQMLQDIRKTIGDEAFFKLLRDYKTAWAGKIASPEDFWRAMALSDYVKIAAIRAKYLHVPDPLHLVVVTGQGTGQATGAATKLAAGAATKSATRLPTAPATDPCCG